MNKKFIISVEVDEDKLKEIAEESGIDLKDFNAVDVIFDEAKWMADSGIYAIEVEEADE